MNKNKLSKFMVPLAALLVLAACDIITPSKNSSNNNSSDNTPSSSDNTPISSDNTPISSSNPPISSEIKDAVLLSGVSAKKEFTLFEQHKNRSSENDDGFFDHSQTYKVGDDNAFNVRPELTVLDATSYLPVSASKWQHDFDITVKLDNKVVGEDYYAVTDARAADIKFTEAAIGKTFTISVVPGGIDASKVATFTKSITVEVVDGYNVYDAKELGYFDTRSQDSTEDSFWMEDDTMWQCKWHDFKLANNMDVNLHPAALIFQKDLKVTVDDLPSNFFYTEAEARALNDNKSAGSLRDWAYLYEHTTEGSILVDGNYFDLDLSAIPLVKRNSAKTTEVGAVVSHSAAFKAIRGEDVSFRNINMSGNAKNAVNDDDKVYGGGFIFIKGAGSKTFSATNIIATQFFITIMGEKPYDESGALTLYKLDKMKCFNNYNSFLYNWGTTFEVKESLFDSCGGPIIIQDHTGTDEYESNNGLIVEGNAPTTTFIDCTLENYVSGSEAWFQQFGATSLISDIKALSDLIGATGLPKSFVVNEKHEGKFTQELAGQKSLFNFIVLNKSGSAEGITNSPNCGTVNFVESEKTTTFNYRQPSVDPVAQAYLAYQAAADADKEAAQQNLIAVAKANGVEFAPDFSDANDKITEYITNICTTHVILRSLNSNGGPVYDFGSDFDLLGYDGKNPYLQTVDNIAKGAAERFTPSEDQIKNMPNYTAIYYSGMALVFGLVNYVR